MYGCLPDVYSYDECEYSVKVRQAGQSFRIQVGLNFKTSSVYANVHSRHISNVPQTRGWEKKIADGPPCVVLASPGFMQVGPSRELFELWAADARNGLVITGYSIEGTLARVSLVVSQDVLSIFGFVYISCIAMDMFSSILSCPTRTLSVNLSIRENLCAIVSGSLGYHD